MNPRLLAAVLVPLVLVLGMHLLLLLAFTLAATIVLVLAWGITSVTMETGWGFVPAARTRSS